MLQQSFDKWTSGNEFIDKFIQETQLNAKYRRQILEWIPYNKLEDIKYLDKGGFSTTVYIKLFGLKDLLKVGMIMKKNGLDTII